MFHFELDRTYTDDKAELRELAGVLNAKADTHELKVSLAEARRMEVRVQEAALGRRARQEAAAKVAQVPTHAAVASREEIRPVGICETPYTAAAKAERQALEAAERALTRAQATDQEKDWQAWEKAKEIAQEAKAAAEKAALEETAPAPVQSQDAVLAEEAKARRLDLMREDAALAAREAEKASRAAMERHNEAVRSSNEAQARAAKARWWEKKAALAAEKAARQRLAAAFEGSKEAGVASRSAQKRLKKVEERSRAAKAAAAEARRSNDLRATREALRARADLSPAEQHRVAEYLSRSANAGILRDCDNPQQAIAAGLIASGTRSAKEATKGLEQSAAAKVGDAVSRNQEDERRRARGRTRGHGLDFGLSL
jgi:hypothetical protein